MVERIYIAGHPDKLKEAVEKFGFVKNFHRLYYYKKSDTHMIFRHEYITSGINKTSGKRYYNFKVTRIDSFKIVDGPGRKFLNCYSITFPTKRGGTRRTRKISELNPRCIRKFIANPVLDMCQKHIGDSPYTNNDTYALIWYWKPLYVYIYSGYISHHKELRGLSGRTSSVFDLSKRLFGSDSSDFIHILNRGIVLKDVIRCAKLFKRLDPKSPKYIEFVLRILRIPIANGRDEMLRGSEYVPDMFLEKVVYECGEQYLKNLGMFGMFAECIDFSEDVSTLVDKLNWIDLLHLLYRPYVVDFETDVDKEFFSDCGFSVVRSDKELIPFVYNNQKYSIFDKYDKNTIFLIYEGDTLIRLDGFIIDGIVHMDGSSVAECEVQELQNAIHAVLT